MSILKQRARELRNHSTEAEKVLWQHLRKRQIAGFKFRRQHILGSYIVDFVCLDLGLVIELDGSQHMDNRCYDEARSRYLQRQGYTVLRYWNNEVISNIDGVLDQILDFAETTPTLTLPLRGRE